MQHCNVKSLEILLEALAKLIIKKRQKLSKSQRLLAFEYGVHKSLINRLENKTSEPKIFTVFKIAEIFEMKTSELIKELEELLPDDFSALEN